QETAGSSQEGPAMMYWLRFAVICASVFILVYAGLSAVLAVVWSQLKSKNLIQGAEALFALRVSPAVSSLIVLILVVAPSFYELEPPATDEWIGFWAALLSLVCLAWLTARGAYLYRAWRSTNKIFRRALPLRDAIAPVPVYELSDPGASLF